MVGCWCNGNISYLYKKKQVRFLYNHLKISKKGVKIYNEI
nr:MAG TPA: hypothetical protein [Caudoviricetes sp.]